ncbi:MAG: serine/threonine-protein phosphatase [Gemmatimonadetes bacterium]|nr:serine/threonine-protein phosphatase [Gemmatimonadota bacterium]NNL30164.1 serine/threonine-protein phosphatase [Gemmatimonadota bacterium]
MNYEPRLASESIAGARPYQEDSVLVQELSGGRVLVAVADGMGGHAAGEVASALALETLVRALEDGVGIDKAVELANREVHEQAKDPGKHGMGTTLTAAIVEDGEYMIANVGDSRGYLINDAGIRQLTEDHSFVAEAMKRGQSEAEAMNTPYRDALTRSIGTSAEVDVDVFGPFPLESDTALLICSDGLYKTLDDGDLRRIYMESGSPLGAAQTLVSSALENGSDDNITVAIAEYGEVPRLEQSTQALGFDPTAHPDDPEPAFTDIDDHAAAGAGEGGLPKTVLTVGALAAVALVVWLLMSLF